MRVRFLLGALCILIVSACASPTPAAPALANTKWNLLSLAQSGATQTPVTGMQVTLEFSNDGHVSGNSGCNLYSGAYQTQGEILKIGELVMTERACADENAMNFETVYLTALQNAQLYEKRADRLTITFANGSGKLTYASVP